MHFGRNINGTGVRISGCSGRLFRPLGPCWALICEITMRAHNFRNDPVSFFNDFILVYKRSGLQHVESGRQYVHAVRRNG
jgi:hypothetical protein